MYRITDRVVDGEIQINTLVIMTERTHYPSVHTQEYNFAKLEKKEGSISSSAAIDSLVVCLRR